MRNRYITKILFFIVTLSGCHSQSVKAPLVGSWKTRDVIEKSDLNVQDSIVFSKNGHWKFFLIQNGKLYDSWNGKYKFDSSAMELQIFSQDTSFHFEVLKLSTTELHLKEHSKKLATRYIRY